MELLPVAKDGARVLVEARIKPADIGFVQVGQPVEVKLSAYEHTVYGGLKGTVRSISPDALGDPDPDRAAAADGTWYRALVEANPATLKKAGQPLPVLPGMLGSVEFRTGQPSMLGFVLQPMLRSQEAFRKQ